MTEPQPRPSTPTVQQGSTPTVQQGAARQPTPTVQQGGVPTVQQGAPVQPTPTVQQGGAPTVQQGASAQTTPTVQQDGVPTTQRGAPVQTTPTLPQDGVPTARQGEPVQTTPTVQQGGVPTSQQGVAPEPDQAPGAPVFPDQLRDRFEPLRVLGTGTEGVVWCCRRVAEGDEVAVKVQFPAHPVDMDLLRHLDNAAFRRHVPQLFGYDSFFGPHGQVGWVAMELLAVTLDQEVTERFATRSPAWASDTLRELAQALHFWQTVVERNPIDVKPDNLMRRANGEFVVVDFGGVTGFTVSKQIGGATMAAVAYTPPEQHWHEKSWPWPWWTLGEIAYLLATGHGRFQRPNREMLSDVSIVRSRTLGEIDLGEVGDERWRLLITGLLTPDPHDRWGWTEVESWLQGGSPAVAMRTAAGTPAHSPITFVDGRTFTDPAALAVTMLDHPHAAERWLTGDGKQDLDTWLKKEKLDQRFDMMRLSRADAGSARLHSAVLAFGAEFAPEVTPRYRGRRVDSDGLAAVPGDPDGFKFAAEVVRGDVLGTAGGYRCEHRGCGPRCAVLDRAATELPVLVQAAEEVVRGTGAAALSPDERELLHGMALLLVLRPDRTARALRPSLWLRTANVSWWRPLALRFATAGTSQGRATLLAQGVLRKRVVDERPPRTTRVPGVVVAKMLGAVALLWAAMTGITWAAVVLRHGELAFEGGPDGMREAVTSAAAAQLGLAPLLFVLAVELVVLMRTKGAVVAGMVLAVALAFAAPHLPLFTALAPPDFVAEQVRALAGAWAEGVVVGLIVMVGGSIAVAAIARSWLPASRSRDLQQRPATPGRRIAVFGLALAALVLLLWAAVVTRLTIYSEDVATTDFGGYGALLQSGHLAVLGCIAAAVALKWKSTNGVLTLGVLAVLAAAIYAKAVPELKALWLPMMREPLLWFAGLWGPGAFWAALLVHLPLAVLCVRGMRRVVGA